MYVTYKNYTLFNSYLKPHNSKDYNFYCKSIHVDKWGEAWNPCGQSVWTEIGFCCRHQNATIMKDYSPRQCPDAVKIKGVYQDELPKM